jgi:hypothetical protein
MAAVYWHPVSTFLHFSIPQNVFHDLLSSSWVVMQWEMKSGTFLHLHIANIPTTNPTSLTQSLHKSTACSCHRELVKTEEQGEVHERYRMWHGAWVGETCWKGATWMATEQLNICENVKWVYDYDRAWKSNSVVEQTVLLLRIWGRLCFRSSPEDRLQRLRFFMVSFTSSRQVLGQYLTLGHDHFLPYP